MGIELIRCDDRLIHGQCITRVLSYFKINQIILVDDMIADSNVMVNIYKMALPSDVHMEVLKLEDSKEYIESATEDKTKTLILFRFPQVAEFLFNQDSLNLRKELNIGPMSNRKTSKRFTMYSNLLPEEQNSIENMYDKGIDIYFQQVPEEKKIPWEKNKKGK